MFEHVEAHKKKTHRFPSYRERAKYIIHSMTYRIPFHILHSKNVRFIFLIVRRKYIQLDNVIFGDQKKSPNARKKPQKSDIIWSPSFLSNFYQHINRTPTKYHHLDIYGTLSMQKKRGGFVHKVCNVHNTLPPTTLLKRIDMQSPPT